MTCKKLIDIDCKNKRVLVRVDFNVPIKNGLVTSDARIRAALPTIEMLLKQDAKVILMSHLGRPTEGELSAAVSLQPVAEHLSQLINKTVRLTPPNWIEGVEVAPGEIVLCENVRCQLGEKANDDALAKKMAALCDIFVMDAFGTAHRAQASTHGVAKFAPIACAGPLLTAELEALGSTLDNPKRPLVAIVGGSKVSTKLMVLNALSEQVDQLIVGGGIANTFLAATGKPIGKSLYEPELVDESRKLMRHISDQGGFIPLPSDVVVGKAFAEDTLAMTKQSDDVSDDDLIFDIGPDSAHQLAEILHKAGTIVWNGPVGVFEFCQFSAGTKAIANAIAHSNAFSIAGGGDTLAAIDQFGIRDKISYISTGGGAFLEFLEGKKLPAVDILESRGS